MKQRQQVAVGGAIFNDKGQLLFVRRIANDEFMPGVWELPGGGTEFGETPIGGLQREIQEECGVSITVGKPVSVHDYYIERNDEKVQRVEIIYVCELVDNNSSVVLSDEHDKFGWYSPDSFEDLEMTSYMKRIVEEVLMSL